MTLADWDLAERVGRQVARLSTVRASGDDVVRLRLQVAEAVALADRASRSVTTLGEDLGPATARVVGRGEWIRSNLASMRYLTDPFAADLLGRSNLPVAVSAKAVGVQVGAIFGFLATRVLGQYEVFLPGGRTPGQLTLVGPNLLQAERDLADVDGIDAGDLIQGVVLHELGHRLQFEGVDWLRGHLHGIITTYLAETQIDPDRVRSGLVQLVRQVREGDVGVQDVLRAFLTPAQAAQMEQAQALMSVLEGHGNIVMDWGVEELQGDGVDPSRVREALNRRRSSHSGPSQLIGRALGMTMKAQQYAVGEEFIADVAASHGREVFHRVWEGPHNIPSPEELEDPDAWVERISRGGLTDDLLQAVRASLDLASGAIAVVAVSGGPDSVALLHLVARARPDLHLVVGHVRHGLRDDAADAAAAAANARALGVDCHVLAVGRPVPGEGPEDAARRRRHRALVDLARQVGATAVLLGHTADDQAETLLLRIARGTGIDGLIGMRAATEREGIRLLRPLLELRRDAVRAIAEEHPTVADPTNADPDQRRARARHVLLPALGALRPDGGDAVAALVRLARLAARDVALLDAVVALDPPRRYGMAVVVPDDPVPPLPLPAPAARTALRARRLRAAWDLLPGPHAPVPAAAAVDAVLALEEGEDAVLSGGVRATRTADALVLRHPDHLRLPRADLPVDVPVPLPGTATTYRLQAVPATAGGPTIHARSRPDAPPPWQADIALPAAGPDGVHVRGRAPGGDREARRVLQQVPAPLRDQVPLVCDADGRVLLAGATVLRPPVAGRARIRVVAEPSDPIA